MRRYMSARRTLISGNENRELPDRSGNGGEEAACSDSNVEGGYSGSSNSSDGFDGPVSEGTLPSSTSESEHESGSGVESESDQRSDNEPNVASLEHGGTASSSLSGQLRDWMISYEVKHDAGDALLKILKETNPDLPSTAKSLLDTPRSARAHANVQEMSGGQTAHLGLKKQMIRVLELTTPDQRKVDELHLSVNIDGMSPFKSSAANFWPVLCCIMNVLSLVVFPVSFFFGAKHPTNLDFLECLVAELAELTAAGFVYGGKKFKVILKAVICDAPARALAKGIYQCGSYFGCDKCMQQGKYVRERNEGNGRVTYPEIACELRTDRGFRRKLQPRHHKVESPFCRLNIDMISTFPIDGMYQVFEGVMKNLLFLWTKGKKNMKRCLKGITLEAVNTSLTSFRSSIPSVFARKPRSLKELGYWKGTEYRQFLLYTGPVVLKDRLLKELYDHFMLLHVAISILVDPALCAVHHGYAHKLLQHYVRNGKLLYGDSYVTYNVHSLVHVAADAMLFGSLDACSAWMFESYLFQVKRMVRSGFRPLEQVICRLAERNNGVWLGSTDSSGNLYNHPDNAFVLDGGRCCKVMQPVSKGNRETTTEVQCIVYEVCSLYTSPCDSALLGSYKVCAPACIEVIKCDKLKHSAICLADGDDIIFLKLRHSDA